MFIPFGFMKSPAGAPPPSYDTDAQAFFTAIDNDGGSLTSGEKDAVNQLVVDLKAGNVWSDLEVAYPFVGSSATEQKYNLKDPRDLDAAYRLDFVPRAGESFDFSTASGSTPPPTGNDSHADTHWIYSSSLSSGNHISLYTTNNLNPGGYDCGAFDNTYEQGLIAGFGNNTLYYQVGNGWKTGNFTGDNKGFFMGNYIADGQALTSYKNTTQIANTTSNENRTASPMFLFNESINGADRGQGNDRNMTWWSTGAGLSSGSISALTTAVIDYQTALGRNV